jgi:RHS repeat-associated protein
LWKTNFSSTGTQVTGYTYNANDQLVTETNVAGSFTNKYDANGSVTNRSSATETNLYSYNLEGKLASATIKRMESGQPILQTNKYFYNSSGIRTRAEMTGSVNQTNIFLNDPQNLTGFSQVLEELPSVGVTPTASYTIGSQVISQKKSGTNLYIMADGHGSTRLLTDTNGTISDRYSYDAYGVALNFTFGTLAPPRTAMLYSGERFDSDLQQYYLRARYYNPTVGRFGVQDQQDGTPNDPLSLHKYAYCQNNPVNGVDPSGNETLVGLTLSMAIASGLEDFYNCAVLYQGYRATVKLTEN